MTKKKIAVLTGAGVSAESGIQTFRDNNGMWNEYSVEDVATLDGWFKNKQLVLDFYNQRRRDLLLVQPNAAHYKLAELEDKYDINIITQNVDDLHERAGSKKVLHLHGELLKSESFKYPELVYECKSDIKIGDLCEKGQQLRPNVVWFGESVPMIVPAEEIVATSDMLVIIGTSMQVYPAAGLISLIKPSAKIVIIDPNIPTFENKKLRERIVRINKTATEGVKDLEAFLKSEVG